MLKFSSEGQTSKNPHLKANARSHALNPSFNKVFKKIHDIKLEGLTEMVWNNPDEK